MSGKNTQLAVYCEAARAFTVGGESGQTLVSIWSCLTNLIALVSGNTRTTLCECGHEYSAHEHYRASSDCGVCGCDHYRRTR
jgi:hypothetical protein